MHLDAAIPQARRPFTPIILGCNLTALALALSLTRKNIPVILLARGALIPDDDAAVPLHPAAVAVLEQLGVWSQLSAHALILDGGWFGDVGRRLDYPFALVPRRALLYVLLSALPAGSVHADTRAVDIRADKTGVTVITAGMEMFCGDTVIDTDAPPPAAKAECCFVHGASQHDTEPVQGLAFASEPGAASIAAGRWWWGLLPTPTVDEEALELCPLSAAGRTLGAVWTERTWGITIEAREYITPTWFRPGSKTLRIARGAWALPPLPLLGPTMDLEAVAALTNVLDPDFKDPEYGFRMFEERFRPRVERAMGLARLVTNVATRTSWWHRVLHRWVAPRVPAWAYAEFALQSHVLDGGKLRPGFVRERETGRVRGRVGDVGLRVRNMLGLGDKNLARIAGGVSMLGRRGAAELTKRPMLRIGVALMLAMLGVGACVRWNVHIAAGRVLGRAVVSAGRRRRF